MNTRRKLLALTAGGLTTLALALGGCAVKPEVRHDQDPRADLKAYRTFAFYESADGARYTTLLASRLKQAARAEMEKHDYVYSETHPDLRVNVMLAVIDRQELRTVPASGPLGYRGWSSQLETETYRQGTLRVDLVDTARKALVWQGVAEGRVTAEAMKNPGHTIDDAVAQVFAGLAPAPRR